MKLEPLQSSSNPNSADNASLIEVEALLDQFAHFGVDLGLERIQQLLADLGNPHQSVPIIHVAGSNGKGSVCAYLSSILTQAGYRVGRYTSPHLIDWCERICINEQPITPTTLHQVLLQTIAAIRSDRPSPTQFEVITAAAWLYFAQQQVDIAVIEVGLGGRLDATNVCDRPLVTIITSLSREHWQRLGPTLADIAKEKAGIFKPESPALVAPLPPEAEAVVKQRITDLNCPAYWIQPSRDLGKGWAEYLGDRDVVAVNDQETNGCLHYPLPLPGKHQLANSALAIAAVQQLRHQGWQISDRQIIDGMAKTRWLARLQWTTWRDQPLLIDGAHNPAGAAMLRQYVDTSDRVANPIYWVMGMIANKDHADVLRELLRPGDRLYLVPVPDHLTAEPTALAELAQTILPDLSCQVCADAVSGLDTALLDKRQSKSASTLVLCGSLYLIGHFLKGTRPGV